MIQLNAEKYWLYAAVDPKTNALVHTKLEPTTTKILVQSFLTVLSENHDINMLCFSLMACTYYKMRVINHILYSDLNDTKIRKLPNVSSEK